MTTLAYFDCFSGISGDMTLGALIDAGCPPEVIREPLSKLPIDDFEFRADETQRQGLRATKVHIHGEHAGVFRNYYAVRALIEEAHLTERARTTALAIYQRLAEAEATVHGTDVGHVHFHELGAVDTIVDVMGAAIALDHLGIDRVVASPVATGHGMMRTEHGMLPIPGPAVVELLKGAPIYSGGIPNELVTPTGAAILAAIVTSWGDLPPMRAARVGYGAGSRELEIPNLLRVLIGEPEGDSDLFGPVGAVLLEANIDDMNPELYSYVIERLLEAGAQDAWLTPIVMKRGRPAVTLSVLVGTDAETRARDVLFAETTTLGMRRRMVEKWTVPREIITVETAGGTVRVKVARGEGRVVVGVAPEFVDCERIARETGMPLKDVYAAADAAAREQLRST